MYLKADIESRPAAILPRGYAKRKPQRAQPYRSGLSIVMVSKATSVPVQRTHVSDSQGFDDGTDNVFYDSDVNEGNYWSNYEGSEGYIIEGDAYSVDFYPLNEGGTIPDIPEYSHSIVFLSLMIAGFVVIFFLFKRNRN